MEKQTTITELLNKIIFLSKALKFYGNKKNYDVNIPYNGELASQIELDEGNQARFALEQIQDIEKYQANLMENYYKNIEKIKSQMDEPVIDPKTQEKLDKISKTINKYGNKDI